MRKQRVEEKFKRLLRVGSAELRRVANAWSWLRGRAYASHLIIRSLDVMCFMHNRPDSNHRSKLSCTNEQTGFRNITLLEMSSGLKKRPPRIMSGTS